MQERLTNAARLALAGLALLTAATFANAAGLHPNTRDQVARSVVQIQARECRGDPKTGSGFAYGPDQHVVTALHVVSGCNRITVFWEKHGGVTQKAEISRVLTGADLALLRPQGVPENAPLAAEERLPKTNDELEVLGYYLAVPTMANRQLSVSYGASKLRDVVPLKIRQQLEQSGAIDVNLDIIRLNGQLLPGHSGAPIFDLQGKVVAVGSGGLKSGAASASWGVPARYLEALLRSNESVSASANSESLFSTPLPQDVAAAAGGGQSEQQLLTCGALQFAYTGVRTFEELTYGHESLDSIAYLVSEADLTEQDLRGFRYHTFQPLDGGAAVAIPDWAKVQTSGGDTCQALGLDGRISVDFASYSVGSIYEAQNISVRFENSYAARSGRAWQPYQPYSYIGPVQRIDGLVANRKTFLAAQPDGSASLAAESLVIHQPPNQPNGSFTGIIGAYWNFDLQAFTYCETASHDTRCQPYWAEERLVAQMILGVFLSTAPFS